MIDYKPIFECFKKIIQTVVNDPSVEIVKARDSGEKPAKLYCTYDIIATTDSAGFLTDSRYDPDLGGYIYETHKDITLQLSVRNGAPKNKEFQTKVYSLCSKLHKSFVHQKIKNELEKIGATIRSTNLVRTLVDSTATGLGTAQSFNVVITMLDSDFEDFDPIQGVDVGGTLTGDAGNIEDIDLATGYKPSCSPLELTKISGNGVYDYDSINIILSGDGESEYLVESKPIQPRTQFEYKHSNINGKCSIEMKLDPISLKVDNSKDADKSGIFVNGDIVDLSPYSPDLSYTFVIGNELIIYRGNNPDPVTTLPITLNNFFNEIKTNFSENSSAKLVFNPTDFSLKLNNTYDICGDEIG